MKTLLITLSFLMAANLFSDELKWVDEQVQAIKPPRSGISSSSVDAVNNPFVFLKKDKEKSDKRAAVPRSAFTLNKRSSLSKKDIVPEMKKTLILDAILNKSALINGKWYKIGEKVGDYTLTSVERNTVLLKYKSKELFLSTDTQSKSLKFKNK